MWHYYQIRMNVVPRLVLIQGKNKLKFEPCLKNSFKVRHPHTTAFYGLIWVHLEIYHREGLDDQKANPLGSIRPSMILNGNIMQQVSHRGFEAFVIMNASMNKSQGRWRCRLSIQARCQHDAEGNEQNMLVGWSSDSERQIERSSITVTYRRLCCP